MKTRVAIIGAGPAGLCLARILQRHGDDVNSSKPSFDVTIYEADASPTIRKQGGSLDLHVETGQRALRAAGLIDEFQKHVQVGGDAMAIRDATVITADLDADNNKNNSKKKILYQDNGNGRRPEIERTDLRNILLASLKPNTVVWGKKLVRVEGASAETIPASNQKEDKSEKNRVRLVFQNGEVQTYDVVVGADGAWSKVRHVLTDAMPRYTGATFWEMEDCPRNQVHESWKDNGTVFALDKAGGVMISHINSQTIHTYVCTYCEKGHMPPVKEILKGWDPDLLTLVGNGAGTMREIFALPIGLEWRRPRLGTNDKGQNHWTHHVALIGDAAHLMSPMAGEGVNLALADAADLATTLLRDRSIAEFEQRYMFKRASRSAQESHDNLQYFFNNGDEQSAEAAAKKMRELMSLRSLLVYFYYMWWDWKENLLWTIGWRVVE